MNPMKCTYACCCALNGIKNGVLPTMASTSERTAVSAVSDVERSKAIEQKGERGLERLTRECDTCSYDICDQTWIPVCIFVFLESGEALRRTVRAVLTDDGFQVPSPSARKSLGTAKRLLAWCNDPSNASILSSFAEELVALQNTCSEKPSLVLLRNSCTYYYNIRIYIYITLYNCDVMTGWMT